MLVEALFLVVYIVLLTHGIHAVTREGMLLQFLGVYIKGERQKKQDEEDLRIAKNKNKDALVAELEEMANGESEHDLNTLLGDFDAAERTAHEVYSPIKYSKDFDVQRSKLHWRILLPIAPMLTECLVCMSSFWSVSVFLLYYFQASVAGIPVLTLFLPFLVAGANYMLTKERNYDHIVDAIKDL